MAPAHRMDTDFLVARLREYAAAVSGEPVGVREEMVRVLLAAAEELEKRGA